MSSLWNFSLCNVEFNQKCLRDSRTISMLDQKTANSSVIQTRIKKVRPGSKCYTDLDQAS